MNADVYGTFMGVDWSRTVLLWDPADTVEIGFDPASVEARGIRTLRTSYDRIGSDPALDLEIQASGADAILFTRNEDMPGTPAIGAFLGAHRKGYTAVSAIDADERIAQTRQCIDDLVRGHGDAATPQPILQQPRNLGRGTFSLIFDLEQFGGARFGMPRLLPLIEARGIRGTFFVTGFVAETYPELIQRIADGGHEIGVHGWMHDFLTGKPLEEQVESVASQARALGRYGDIAGANFIYRMDAVSPHAILCAGLRYLVLFRKNLFYRSRFMSASTRPRPLRTAAGDVTIIPVPVETYNLERPMLRAMLESAWKRARRDRVHHVSVLMHPFKDGARIRLPITEWVLDFLVTRLRLTPVPLKEVPRPIPSTADAIAIAYRWDGFEPAPPPEEERSTRALSWWSPMVYHARRTEDLADALSAQGCPGVLCVEAVDPATVHVYPDRPRVAWDPILADPLLNPRACARRVLSRGRGRRPILVGPGSNLRDLFGFVWFHIPRTLQDLAFTLPKVWNKLAGVLRRGPRAASPG